MSMFRVGYVAVVLCGASAAWAESLEEGFARPPAVAMPGVWWRWIDGNVTREGISRDLSEMARKGIRSVDIFDVSGGVPAGPAGMMGPQWRELFQHTLAEAAELGIEVRLTAAAGWGMGGPWIDAKHATKKLAYAEIQVQGPARITQALAKPAGSELFYDDVAVVAFREPDDAPPRPAQVTASSEVGNYCTDEKNFPAEDIADGDPQTCWKPKVAPTADAPQWVEVRYHAPLVATALHVASPAGAGPRTCDLEATADGATFTKVADFVLEAGATTTLEIPPTEARAFRLRMTSAHVPDVQLAEFCALRAGDRPHVRPGIKWWIFKSGKRAFWDWPAAGPAVLREEYAEPDVVDCRSADTIELTRSMDPSGMLTWDAPPGRWAIARFGATLVGEPPRAMSAALSGGYEADPYSPAAADLLYDKTISVVLKDAGPAARLALKGGFLDSHEIGAAAFGIQGTWTNGFRDTFRRQAGYDLVPYLPAMARRVVDGRRQTNRFFWDYRRALAQCYLDFYARITERAHRDGLVMRAENGYGSYPFPHIDGLAAYGRVDEPMGEFWFNDGSPWGVVMKQHYGYVDSVRTAASAARIYGKPLVVAESLTIADGTRHPPAAWKAELDAQFANGVNAAMIHLWSHQPDVHARPGLFTFDALNANMTWWERSDAFLDYLGRCQFLLRQGRSVADCCYFFGEDTAQFVPGRGQVRPALPAGYEFDGINAEVILTRLACRDGLATLPDGQSYRYLVLPASDGWPVTLPVLEKIAGLVAEGLTVIGPRPGPSPRLLDSATDRMKREGIIRSLWGDAAVAFGVRRVGKGRVVAGVPLAEFLATEKLAPDVAARGEADPGWANVTWAHRRDAGTDIYFLANSGAAAVRQVVSFRISGSRPEAWDPLTGTRRDVPEWSAEAAVTHVPLRLEPSGSVFVVFRGSGKVDSAPPRGPEPTNEDVPDWKPVLEVAGPWQVTFAPQVSGKGAQPPTAASFSATFDALADWTKRPELEIRHHAGEATYRTTLVVPASMLQAATPLALDLGAVKEIATVRLNGKPLGTVWCPPWRVAVGDALHPGENQLEIDVVNLWRNRLIGDAAKPADERVTRTTIVAAPTEPLLPSGLVGPVRLMHLEAAAP
ncbi:MAG: glycosyl hydrolase [Planctomycetia bacterium]